MEDQEEATGFDQSLNMTSNNLSVACRDLGQVRKLELSAAIDLKKPKDDQKCFSLKSSKVYQFDPPELSNKAKKVNPSKMDEQIEAFIENVEVILKQKFHLGITLNPQKVSEASLKTYSNFETTKKVLGRGNSAGEIFVVKDKVTGCEMAQKTIMIAEFRRDQIRLWAHLSKSRSAPELYSLRVVDNKVEITMEIVEGKTLETIINDLWDLHHFGCWKPEDSKNFALIILHDLLGVFQKMIDGGFSHGDFHAGNIMMDKRSLDMKVIDFDKARQFMGNFDKNSERVQFDMIQIIRIFSAFYSGYGFEDNFQAKKMLEANNFESLTEDIKHIPEENRKEMYRIIMLLFDCVRDKQSKTFAQTAHISKEIEKNMSQETIWTIKKKVAVILFPELLERSSEEADGGCEFECETQHDDVGATAGKVDATNEELYDMKDSCGIWQSSKLENYVHHVTDDLLNELGMLTFK